MNSTDEKQISRGLSLSQKQTENLSLEKKLVFPFHAPPLTTNRLKYVLFL